MEELTVLVTRQDGIPVPAYATPLSSGMDLHASLTRPAVLRPLERMLIPTGLSISIPGGYEGQIRPRSGLALRHGITVLNTPGTIDSDYRGEVGVILYNFGKREFTVRRGDRIAQIVFSRLPLVDLVEDDAIDETGRGAGGFGHTG